MSIKTSVNRLVQLGIKKTTVDGATNYTTPGVIRNNAKPADATDPKINGGLKSPITINVLTSNISDVHGNGSVLIEEALTMELVDADGNIFTVSAINWPP